MKRRNFIKILSGASIMSLGGYVFVPSFIEVAQKIIEDASSNLKMDKKVGYNFMKDASIERYWNLFSPWKKEFIKAHFLFGNKLIPLPYSNKYKQYKDEIVGQFLLSTDFFINKMDKNKPIKYVAFYNPYKRPCANPFSALFYKV